MDSQVNSRLRHVIVANEGLQRVIRSFNSVIQKRIGRWIRRAVDVMLERGRYSSAKA